MKKVGHILLWSILLGLFPLVRLNRSTLDSTINSCPVNPTTAIQWIYNPQDRTCIYPRVIAGRGETGQQTDIVLNVDEANAYAKSVSSPRSLFFEPARLLNNTALTNMSDDALAALVYGQVFVEEKWFKDYNWFHPYWNSNRDPEGGAWPLPNSLNTKRYAPVFLGSFDQWACDLQGQDWPYRLCGFGFGLGNQQLYQAWDAAQWYLEYMRLVGNRYGLPPRQFSIDKDGALGALAILMQNRDAWLPSPDVQAVLRDELSDAVESQFWNTMRFVWAGARQREGIYLDARSDNEKRQQAIDYSQILGTPPGGRPQKDVSAFSLITTIYTDTITVPDVTGFGTRYIARDGRSTDAWRAFVSERNKAIRVVELLATTSPEGVYRIQQALAVGPFKTRYENPEGADFLPYSREEVGDLVNALLYELNNSGDKWVSDEASKTLTSAVLLQQGYQHYTGQKLNINRNH